MDFLAIRSSAQSRFVKYLLPLVLKTVQNPVKMRWYVRPKAYKVLLRSEKLKAMGFPVFR